MAAESFRLVQDLFSPWLPCLGELYVSTLFLLLRPQPTLKSELALQAQLLRKMCTHVVLQTGQS